MFIISTILVLMSSYFLACSIKSKQDNFIYFLLIAFSQIVFSFEILSLFGAISKNNFLICNILFLIISITTFIRTGKEFLNPDIKNEIRKIKNAIKADKSIMFLTICFCLFIIVQLYTALFFPITFGDALSYHLTRCTAWIQNGSFHHYITPDTRELIMPINMDILYTWFLLFRKNEIGISVFSFTSYLGYLYVIYNFLKELGFSIRKRLWSILVVSSFTLLIIEMYTPCDDLFIGVLILSSIYLFFKSCKYNNKLASYFSALSYALAVGTKVIAITAIPAIFVVFLIIAKKYKQNIIKTIATFGLFFIINFIIFSSYNYILNFIQFANPFSSREQFLLHQFRGGFKGWLCNLIKYSFVIFDTSGINGLNGFINYLQSLVLALIGETDKSYTSAYFGRYFEYNSKISITESALGIMGLFAFLPSLIKSIRYSKSQIILSILSISLIINILIYSGMMVFTQFNMRYLLTFVMIASPIVVYSYIKRINFLKGLMCTFILMTFIVVPFNSLKNNNLYKIPEEIDLYNYIIQQNNINNIAIIANQGHLPVYYIFKARLNGSNIEQPLLENIEEYDLKKYDYIITNKENIFSTNIVKFQERIKSQMFSASKCIYSDYKQNIIFDENENPAMVTCKIRQDYFEEQGFKAVENISLKKYFLYKKI